MAYSDLLQMSCQPCYATYPVFKVYFRFYNDKLNGVFHALAAPSVNQGGHRTTLIFFFFFFFKYNLKDFEF